MQIRQVASRQVNVMASARELIKWAEQELDGKCADPHLDSVMLLSEVTEINRTHLLLEENIKNEDEVRFRSDIKRRITSEPIQYITGRAYFRKLTLSVGPGVLIPRPESELLVSDLLAKISHLPRPNVVDLGAGSGALALSIAKEVVNARVVAVEKDSEAMYWLRKNVNAHNQSVEIVESDVADFDGQGKFDAVIANPPYIPTSEHLPIEVANFEPHQALFGGVSGIELPEIFIGAAERALRPGGYFVIEHHESQGGSVKKILERSFNNLTLHYDLNNRPRWSSGVRK